MKDIYFLDVGIIGFKSNLLHVWKS